MSKHLIQLVLNCFARNVNLRWTVRYWTLHWYKTYQKKS